MNIIKLQEKVKIQQQNEAQHKDNITNLRKEINEIKKLKKPRLLKKI